VQFHPTALMLPGAPHFLISEAVRGEGARLRDHRGQSPVAHLAGADLAPRDQVSRALARHMQEQRVGHVWLDLRPVGEERLLRQFPTIVGRCRQLGLEPTREPLPVAPAAHYWMGGVATDLRSATSVPGLYAVGEVACTGVHGANRLASNSLMECLVFARQLGEIALPPQPPGLPPAAERRRQLLHTALPDRPQLLEAIGRLRDLCWQVAGVERQGHSLGLALGQLQRQRQLLEAQAAWRQAADLPVTDQLLLSRQEGEDFAALQEWHQRLILTELLVEAALFRRESRGGHFRSDAPAPQPYWRRHSLQEQGSGIRTSPVRE